MNNNCPCVITKIPCTGACTCTNPAMSGGCFYCPIYGSEEQKLEHAKLLKLRNEEYYEMKFLLTRLFCWDMMDASADGKYWKQEINELLNLDNEEPI